MHRQEKFVHCSLGLEIFSGRRREYGPVWPCLRWIWTSFLQEPHLLFSAALLCRPSRSCPWLLLIYELRRLLGVDSIKVSPCCRGFDFSQSWLLSFHLDN